jgi:YD repeat-containing protein
MPRLKAANNAHTVLVQAVGASDPTIYVQDVSKFPTPPFRISVDAEIMEVTAVDTNLKSFTVLRAQEGTVAATHSIGAAVENRFTAGTLAELADKAQDVDPIASSLSSHTAATIAGGAHGGLPAHKSTHASGGSDALSPADIGAVALGTNNQVVNLIRALNQQIDTRSLVLSYTSGMLTSVTEKDGNTTVKTTTLTYDASGRLTQVQEQAGGKTVTISLSYNADGTLASVSRSVA